MSAAEGPPPSDGDLALLAERLGQALLVREWRMATAESCTGGWIAKAITDIAGSSAWFDSGVVTYSNQAKMRELGVAESLLAQFGAVSEPVVRAMAEALVERGGAEVGVAVSGIAGPTGASPGKPVGLVCFAWVVAGRTLSTQQVFSGDRDSVRRYAVGFAFEHLIGALAD